ncbi:MAG TPA: hypothetical protein PLP88_14385, partial [Bacteroidales bacterium]|nr:hypothetical protein [Bacteroidales bacterium]
KFENQVSGWATLNNGDPLQYQAGGRYIPDLSITDSLKNNRKIDLEVAANVFGTIDFKGKNYDAADGRLKPYRCWLRYSTPRLELRAGLQKINFGSATIFRPLMWFDKLDFRDPLQLTDGVYALLGRYYFKNNANLWLWTLYGNDDPAGWDPVPSKKNEPEFGGRIQLPVPKGEAALTYHHRKADFSGIFDTIPFVTEAEYPEDKLGIDGKWDLGIGLWFEAVVKHNDPDNKLINPWETYLNLGADYTISIGNGLTVMAEYFRYDNTSALFKTEKKSTFSACSLNYPFGLMNSATAVIYYNLEDKQWSRFISLQRKYDYWSFYLLAFWNPDKPVLSTLSADRNLYAGKGLQFMAVVNF